MRKPEKNWKKKWIGNEKSWKKAEKSWKKLRKIEKNLKKGYAILRSENNIIKSVQSLKKINFFDVTLKDGVINIKKKNVFLEHNNRWVFENNFSQ